MIKEECTIDSYGKQYSIKLMINNARKYKYASGILKKYDMLSTETGDAWYLLRVFSLELYLKALQIHSIKKIHNNHRYGNIFQSLPTILRNKILERFNKLQKEHHLQDCDIEDGDMISNLNHFGDMFLQTRYYFDKYKTMSKKQIKERNENILNPDAQYDIEYKIDFLNNIITALEQQCDSDKLGQI